MEKTLLRFDTEKTLVFFDYETLNLLLNFCHNLVWQASLLKVKDNKTVDELDMLIKWNTNLKISEDAARITRYDQSKVDRLGITPELAFENMYQWLNEADYIIGHNILGFDAYLLKEFCLLYKKPYKQFLPKFIDTLCLAKGIKSSTPFKEGESLIEYQFRMNGSRFEGQKNSLSALAKQYGIEVDETKLHDSLYDLSINKQVWDKIKFQIDI